MKNNIKINMFIVVIITCFIISFYLLNILGKKVFPIFMEFAESELKSISTILINKAINNHLSSIDNFENVIIVTKSNNDEIQMIDFNSTEVNKILKSTTEVVLESLKSIEEGKVDVFSNAELKKYSKGIIYEIPLGRVTNNLFLGNLGPKIPVKLSLVGDVFSNLNTKVKEYGINNALVELSINVTITQRIIIPFISEKINISCDVPISLKLIQGNVPIYYGSGISKGSSILSIPTE